MQWFGLTAHIKSEESLTQATQKVSCTFGAHVQSAVWVPVLLAEAQTCRNGFSFLKDGTLGFSYASLSVTHSTRLCKPSLWTSSTSPQAPGHSLPLPCPALIIALYSFSLQMQGRSLCSKPILLEEFKSLLSLDSRYLLCSFSVLHLALKHLCGFIIGFHIKFVSKCDTISSWINFVCCA